MGEGAFGPDEPPLPDPLKIASDYADAVLDLRATFASWAVEEQDERRRLERARQPAEGRTPQGRAAA